MVVSSKLWYFIRNIITVGIENEKEKYHVLTGSLFILIPRISCAVIGRFRTCTHRVAPSVLRGGHEPLLPQVAPIPRSVLQLIGRHFTHHWSVLHGPLSPSLGDSTERAPWISLPNFGNNWLGTLLKFPFHINFPREYYNVNEYLFPPKLQTITSLTRYGSQSSHMNVSDKCLCCWVCLVLSKHRGGVVMGGGEVRST